MIGILDSNSHDNGPLMRRVGIAMIVLSGVAVMLRFGARKLERQSLWWDDWIILGALPWTWVCIAVHIVGVDYGFGKHITEVPPEDLVTFFKMLYIAEVTYPICIAIIKWSIIAFYRRVFAIQRTRIPLFVLGGLVAAWMVSTVIAAVFSCVPIEGFWIRSMPSVCIDNIPYFEGLAVPNIITDFVIMVFPMPMIWQLQLPRSQKLALMGIFAIGGFVIVVSTLRLVIIIDTQYSSDETWILIPIGLFNAIEISVGILLACLPLMRPLLRFALRQSFRSTLTGSSNRRTPEPGINSDNLGSRSSKTYWKSIGGATKSSTNDPDGSFRRLNESQTHSEDGMPVGSGCGKNCVKISVGTDLELGEMNAMPDNEQKILVRSETLWEYQNA